MPIPIRRVLVVLLPLLLGGLVACGGTDPDARAGAGKDPAKPAPVPAKGTCWDDQQLPQALGEEFDAWVKKYAGGDAAHAESMRDDAAFRTRIDCAKPHSLEVYNVVEPDAALGAQVKQYADLLDQTSPLYRQIRDQVNDRCVAESPYGQAMAAAGLPVQLGPSLSSTGGLHVAWDPYPADLWAKGEHKFVCTFEQDRPGTLMFAQLTTSRVPVEARVCLNTPGSYVPCSGKHQAEDIGEMFLNTAIEKGMINGAKAVRKGAQGKYVALSDAEYAKLDKVCQNLLAAVSTGKAGVAAKAYPGSVDLWPSDSGVYVASCFALKPYEPPPPVTGTVFDKP